LSWQEIIGNLNNVKFRKKFLPLGASCGSFEFEIRCWDIDTTSTDKISNLFDINKSKIRESISYYKGLSVYRDQVLVLPKDEGTRDWLGIDLRRISHVGERISTNQIIGCAYITSDNNPNLKDASDREGFAENRSVEEFKLILTSIIKLLETERSIDKEKIEPSITSLFKEINAERILRKAEELYKKNAIPENYLATIKEFNSDLNKTRRKIEENFKYYGQLATLGQISGVILHEIRTGLSSIGTFFIKLEDEKILLSEDLQFYLETANKSVERLDNLANQFTKFASRKAKKNSLANLKDSINSAIQLLEKDISDNNVKISIDNEMDFSVIIDNADLITVIINILLNAIYWVSTKNNENNRKITISSRIKDKRILLKIEDNGPGVDEKDIGVIFQPGITRKPDGIGMGLPISVYLLDNFKSRVFVEKKGSMTGASFVVELFLSEE
jgi:C4-dicarboxylate-specific signal transduction histidine kinase